MKIPKSFAALFAISIAASAWPAAVGADIPDTVITSGPVGESAGPTVTFGFVSSPNLSSTEPGTFECRLDSTDPADWTACTSPRTYAGLQEGEHVFEVRAHNGTGFGLGNVDYTPAVATFHVHGDHEPPQTTITEAPTGTIATDSATFAFVADEPASFECSLDAGPWTPCESPAAYASLAQGPHSFEARAVDLAGNVDPTPASAAFAVDSESPQTAIDSTPVGTIDEAEATFTFTATEPGEFECRLDSTDPAAWFPCTSPVSFPNLAEGDHVFEVRAKDAVGNVDPTPAAATFSVDLGPPDPVAGQSVNLEPVDGAVVFKCPGEDEFERLKAFKQVPLGCLINTRNGTVKLTASKGSSGDLQSGNFWGGLFVASQKRGDNQKLGLKLVGKRRCERKASKANRVGVRERRKRRRGRRLWGSGTGSYTTQGSYGSATVRGTTWLVIDRCDSSTLFKVAEGTVWIRDFVKKKNVVLSEGESYVAKAKIPRLRFGRSR